MGRCAASATASEPTSITNRASLNFAMAPYALDDFVKSIAHRIATCVALAETDCVAGHIGFEPPNPVAGYLIGFA